jgi:hypothetical protein
MGLLADDARFDRRSGLRALLILLLVLALAFGVAWMTLGRTARFQSLKGVFLSFELPSTFTEVDEEGAGESLTSLGQSAELQRTYATTLPPTDACRALTRSFERGNVAAGRAPSPVSTVTCSFSGTVGRFSFEADVRTSQDFLSYVRGGGLDMPELPRKTRAVVTIVART